MYLQYMNLKIEEYERLKADIVTFRRLIPLNFIALDCASFNDALVSKVNSLIKTIVQTQVDRNAQVIKHVIETFEEMASRAGERVDNTAQLVALTNYLTTSMSETFFRMKQQIMEAMNRVLFLLDLHTFSDDDLALHAKVYNWPENMDRIFQKNNVRLTLMREQAEENLITDRAEFEKHLIDVIESLEVYKNKEVPFLAAEEMRTNSNALQAIYDDLQQCITNSERLNEEERLLDQEQTNFADLQVALQLVDPYHKLWTTAYDFHVKNKLWSDGPFMGLDANAIAEEVENMWKTMYKLSKQFNDQPGPKKVAETVRRKMEKFKQFIPLLVTICNPGLRERHWKAMSDMCGVKLEPTEETTLMEMIATGLAENVIQIEEIGAAATKEYQLERNLAKMKSEWTDVKFELIPYR